MFGNKLIMDGHKAFPLLYISIEPIGISNVRHFQSVTLQFLDGIGFGIEKNGIEKVLDSVAFRFWVSSQGPSICRQSTGEGHCRLF